MFKKLFSAVAFMLFVCGINTDAQQINPLSSDNRIVSETVRAPVTSKIKLQEDEYWTGYWDGIKNGNTDRFGVKKTPMTYDVAIRIPAGSAMAVDKTIEGVRVLFEDHHHIENLRVWMSDILPETAEKATICCQNVEYITSFERPSDPYNEVRFETPYLFDSSKDLYIGYSFNVTGGGTDAEYYPVYVQRDQDMPDAFYAKVDGNYGKWTDYYGQGYGALTMQVLMKGIIYENAGSISADLHNLVAAPGQDVPYTFVVGNAGTAKIDNIDATLEFDGKKTDIHLNPLANEYGDNTSYSFETSLKAPETAGSYDFSITINKVNGVENECTAKTGKGTLSVLSRLVKHKVVIEEFTGMWCGWCPLGIVGLQKARNIYGDDVVLVAVHSQDPLNCEDYRSFVTATVSGFPNAHVDRAVMSVNPYYARSSKIEFAMGDEIEKRAAVLPVAEVIADAQIDGDILTAKSDVRFLYTGDANYAVAFVITEDSMRNDGWKQYNNLVSWRGQGLEDNEPLFDKWINGNTDITDIQFDEVAIAAQGLTSGIEGSIPAHVEEEKANVYTTKFDLNDYKQIIDRAKLNVCVFLIDKNTGEIVNADCKSVGSTSGICGVETDGDNVIETARYMADGRRIYTPVKGLNVIKYSDGSTKKVIVR